MMKTPEQLVQELLKHPDIMETGLGLCLLVDDAPNFPIVLEVVEQADIDDAVEAEVEGYVYPWKAGEVRFAVSDGVPGHRSGADNYVSLIEAMQCAIKQEDEVST